MMSSTISPGRWTDRVGESVIILAQDLIWAERLVRAATEAGARPTRVGSEQALADALGAAGPTPAGLASATPGPAFVIVDLTAHAYDPFAAIALADAAGAHVLAVGQHDDVPQRKQALAAGAERVLAYRKLFEDGPATIAAWLARAAQPASTGAVT